MVKVALLMGIMFFLQISRIGYLPVGPIFATTMHIPVLLGACLYGPGVGAFLGLCFGMTSWIQALQGASGAMSFIFMNPGISVLPRVIFGAVAGFSAVALRKTDGRVKRIFSRAFWAVLSILVIGYFVYTLQKGTGVLSAALLTVFVLGLAFLMLRYRQEQQVAASFSAALGTALNTLLVMGLIYLFYADGYMLALGLTADQALATVLSVCLLHGIPETILAVVIVTPAIVALNKRGIKE